MGLRATVGVGILLAGTAAAPRAAQAPAAPPSVPVSQTVDGVTLAAQPDALYVPLQEVAAGLGWSYRWSGSKRALAINGQAVPARRTRRSLDGALLVDVNALAGGAATVRWDRAAHVAAVEAAERVLWVREGPKRVAINRKTQRLRAWQGDRLVLETRVSTGRPGDETPTGAFNAGPLKTRLLISHRYNDAELPWAVQVKGNVLIHGFASVPPRAASHGCIRVPLTGSNAARWIYDWIDLGTPVVIADVWPGGAATRAAGKP